MPANNRRTSDRRATPKQRVRLTVDGRAFTTVALPEVPADARLVRLIAEGTNGDRLLADVDAKTLRSAGPAVPA